MEKKIIMMDINEIIVPKFMLESEPKDEKVNKNYTYFMEHNKVDRPVVLTKDNVIKRNYLRYFILKMFGITEVPVRFVGH